MKNTKNSRLNGWPDLLLLWAVLMGVCRFCSAGIACLSNPCIFGVCIDDLHSEYSCFCIDGYTGHHCQTNWDECWSMPCKNGGQCFDGVAQYNCSCLGGFTGQNCDVNIDECMSNPCRNGAACVDLENGYNCDCAVGFLGVHCEVDVAVCKSGIRGLCLNGGECIDGIGMEYTCECAPGWGGRYCETDLDECESSPCQNGAICIDKLADYACACALGFTGTNCEEELIRCEGMGCRNGGLCLVESGGPRCYCVPDYHGEFCEERYDECQLPKDRCYNGGKCLDGVDEIKCSCPFDFSGTFCECSVLDESTMYCNYTDYAQHLDDWNLVFETTTTPLTSAEITAEQEFLPELVATTETVLITTIATDDETTSEEMEHTTVNFDFQIEELATTSTEYIPVLTTNNVPMTTQEVPDTTDINEMVSTIDPRFDEIYTTESMTTPMTPLYEFHFENTYSTTEQPLMLLTTEYIPLTTIDLIESNIIVTQADTTTGLDYLNNTISVIGPVTFGYDETTEDSQQLFGTSTNGDNGIGIGLCELNVCQNGGTCVNTATGYKCSCPFNMSGQFCETLIAIQSAAFSGQSYLTHKFDDMSTLSDGKHHMQISVQIKTFSTNGLILLASALDEGGSHYMALFIQNGFLQFQFSCGLQTMLLSELETPINTGNEMFIEVNLDYSITAAHCDASLRINNSIAISGDQPVRMSSNPFLHRRSLYNTWLHFGGMQAFALDVASNIGNKLGFIGCIYGLKINGQSRRIFNDAVDGFSIAECWSMTCLPSPCPASTVCADRQGAEPSTADNWSCKCSAGFLPDSQCAQQLSVCDNNPCQFGATCVPISGSGYMCLCPFRKHGHFCDRSLDVVQPSFAGSVNGYSSYLSYLISIPIEHSFELSFKIIPSTLLQISLLAFIGQSGFHDERSDHLAVSFVQGFIMVTWNLGSGPRRIFTKRPVDVREGLMRKPINITVGRDGRHAWLSVNGDDRISGQAIGQLAAMNVTRVLYVGGHDQYNFSTLPHDLPLHSGFQGCIFDVQIKSKHRKLSLHEPDELHGRSVSQCGLKECHRHSCQNGGACLNTGPTFSCICQDSWHGPLCSHKQNFCDSQHVKCAVGSKCVSLVNGYECDCPLGRIGRHCEMEINYLSDVSMSGRRSYLSLKPPNQIGKFSRFTNDILSNSTFLLDLLASNGFPMLSMNILRFISIEFQVRTYSKYGLLLYYGDVEHNVDNFHGFISVALNDGCVELRIQSFRESRVELLQNDKPLNVGEWHVIKIRKNGRRLSLSVDDSTTAALCSLPEITLKPSALLHLGGVPDLSRLPFNTASGFPVPFTGCFSGLLVNNVRVFLNGSFIVESQNINDCDGTACGRDVCGANGQCWLDDQTRPQCTCAAKSHGPNCEQYESCQRLGCSNYGKCMRSGRCSCPNGYTGYFCDIKLKSNPVSSFYGNSYLVLPSPRIPIKDKRAGVYRNATLDDLAVSLNFSTIATGGLLLWTAPHAGSYLGIGLQNGVIKIACNMLQASSPPMAFSMRTNVSDGGWHVIGMHISTAIVRLRLDDEEMVLKLQLTAEEINVFSVKGSIYIGGLPDGKSVFNRTAGQYETNFNGCINNILYGNNTHDIQEFSTFEGENMGTCDY